MQQVKVCKEFGLEGSGENELKMSYQIPEY